MSAGELCGIIGWPVTRSLSPAIHRAAFAATGLDWTYVALSVPPGATADGVMLVRELGFRGANVTVPHKVETLRLLDAAEGDAGAAGAVNTIVRDGRRLVGHNTDGAGFVRFLRGEARLEPGGLRALVVGAGGAARAVAVALAGEGARVWVSARRSEQAAEVAGLSADIRPAAWGEPVEADLVVQATPARDGLPELPLTREQTVVDLIYRAPETPILARARAAGARAFGGLGMLVEQAALAFELWTGAPAPVDAMRSAATAAAGDPGTG